MLTAETDQRAPIDPPKLSHWLAILAACRESVRVWVSELCAFEGPEFARNLIEHFSTVSVPASVASLTFQMHRGVGNARAKESR